MKPWILNPFIVACMGLVSGLALGLTAGPAAAQCPVYLTQWGTRGSGDGQFTYPFGLATDGTGNLYVADAENNRIQKFSGAGAYLAQWGGPGAGSGDGQFNYPADVATDAAGNVYVADFYNHRVQKFTATGGYLAQWGSFGAGTGQFSYPIGVATDGAGDVYVSEYG